MAAAMHRVVVVGGGFGGLQAAQHLRHAPVEVTLVDRRNFHLFQPLSYQVATGALSPGEVAYPLRALFRGSENVRVLLAEVEGFGLEEWREVAAEVKSLESALTARSRILAAFERAERTQDAAEREAQLTFVI